MQIRIMCQNISGFSRTFSQFKNSGFFTSAFKVKEFACALSDFSPKSVWNVVKLTAKDAKPNQDFYCQLYYEEFQMLEIG